MMTRNGFNTQIIVVALISLSLFTPASPADAVETLRFANGINLTLHSPEDITADLVAAADGRKVLSHPAAGTVVLEAAGADMVPYDREAVIAALEAMSGFVAEIDVDVFLLPAPPANIGSSFARRGAIYLAPGRTTVHPATAAYIVTHEMGHVLTWAFLDAHPRRWEAYGDLRGLTEANFATDASHSERAREILAEDIRFLFGGALATSTGTIENHDLVLPDRVEGLTDLLAGFFGNRNAGRVLAASTAFPNPCNPQTTIELVLPEDFSTAGQAARLRIFDIRGTLVRALESDYVANGRVAIQWNGQGENGRTVSSGRYMYIIQLGDVTARGSVTLLK